jgi:hypothetical protein
VQIDGGQGPDEHGAVRCARSQRGFLGDEALQPESDAGHALL